MCFWFLTLSVVITPLNAHTLCVYTCKALVNIVLLQALPPMNYELIDLLEFAEGGRERSSAVVAGDEVAGRRGPQLLLLLLLLTVMLG